MTDTAQTGHPDWALMRDYLLQLLDDRDETLYQEGKFNGYCQGIVEEHKCMYDDSCEDAARERELIEAIVVMLRRS